MDLSGQVALVTGSAHRLGRSIGQALAAAGADIAVHYHSSAEAANVAVHEFRDLGVRAEAFKADLRDPDQIGTLFAALVEQFGKLDVLVNSAALFQRKPALEITLDDWNSVINLNLRAAFLCSQRAAELMLRAGGGAIVNIADAGAFQPWPGYAHHCISKAGLLMMTRVLARALAPEIRVNAIAPGPVLPPEELDADERGKLAEMTALKKLGTPEDVARTVLFLLESDYITGETIVVDGGKLLGS